MKHTAIVLPPLVLFICVACGCHKMLDVKPEHSWTDETFYTTTYQANLALSGIYSQLSKEALYGYRFNVMLEAGTDETYTNDPGATWAAAKYEYTSSSDEIKNTWLQFYSCIHLANQLEKNLKAELFSEEEYNLILAKARFMRGFSYFTLANWFGPVPLRLTPSSSQKDNDFPPSPVLDVYKQVEKDWLFAAAHLLHAKESRYVAGEPNKMAAHGLLARLYLRMGGFQPYLSANEAECFFENPAQYFVKAKEQCEIVINDGWHGIVPFSTDTASYRNHFLKYIQEKYDTRESLFEISFGNLITSGITVHGRMGNINGVEFVGTPGIPRGFANVNAALPVYLKYSPEDRRRDWSIAGYKNNYSSSTGLFTMRYILNSPLDQEYGIGKYRRWEPTNLAELKSKTPQAGAPYTTLNSGTSSATDANYTGTNFPILRYADILLMHAEASIGGRFGTANADAGALNSLNKVRERAGLTPYTESLAHEDFFNELVDERLRELCFEGLRKQDLIRWNLIKEKLDETNASIINFPSFTASNQFHQAYLTPGLTFNKARHLLLPYPLQEVAINPSLKQRSGW